MWGAKGAMNPCDVRAPSKIICLPDPVFPLQVICTDRQPASTLPKHSGAGVQGCRALDMWPLTLGASKPGSMAGGQHRLLRPEKDPLRSPRGPLVGWGVMAGVQI